MTENDKINILLVDDQPGKLLTYEAILGELNENLIKAHSAQEALQHLLKTDIAVILLDACMPEIDGFELAQMIRSHPRCQKTAIILVSAVFLSDLDRLRGYGCGAVDYVPVPVVPELLRAKVGIFADLYRKTEQLSRMNVELERRVAERTSQLEAAAAHLRESEARFRRTFECNMIPMGIWAREGTVTDANDALLELLQFTRADLEAGRVVWRESDPTDGHPSDLQFLGEIAEHGVSSPYEKYIVDSSGRRIPILFGGATFDTGADRGVFFAVDLTERRRAEEDRGRLLESERRARGMAEQANRLKDEFLATLSHELRTPINSVLGWVHLIQRDQRDAATLGEGLTAIERGVRDQVRLIDELLDVNRISSGKFRIGSEPLFLSGVLQAAIDTITPDATERGVVIRRSGDDESGIVLRGDATRIQQVFWNLLNNAAKFTPSGGRIDVSVQRDAQDVCVRIADTGEGIKPEFLPHMFERFRQADSSSTRRHGGLGLGLAIAKHIVELHGGTICADSAGEGRGATLTVRLPLASAESSPAAKPEPAEPLAPIVLTGLRVLVVDDDQATRDIVSRTLAEYAATVQAVASADEALATINALRPHVLISDIGMPGKDGYALIREIRARNIRIRAIALTAYTSEDDRQRALSAGYNLHVSKPIHPHDLLQAVHKLSAAAATEDAPRYASAS